MNKMDKLNILGRHERHSQVWFVFFASFLALILVPSMVDFLASFNGKNNSITFIISNNLLFDHRLRNDSIKSTTLSEPIDKCSGRYVFVHDLPSRFNDDILNDCHSLCKWLNMCPYISNSGLGPRIAYTSERCWYSTNQFMLEVIFHRRMMQYECLTNDSSKASAFFVPFYVGLDVGRFLWEENNNKNTNNVDAAMQIDRASLDAVKWLAEKPEWKKMWGRDHFLVGGRVAWDFRRPDSNGWGSKFMVLPEARNMTMLTIEGTSWNNDFAIPYPTYFHPRTDRQVLEWQEKMRSQDRHFLFSFVGGPRPGQEQSIRGQLMSQCQASNGSCLLLNCHKVNCDDPVNVMNVFQDSVFCLQPPGDSFTRRSIFDSILAGCIPVFFHPGSAYVQYIWYLPKNHLNYSVFVPEVNVREGRENIVKTLRGISKKDVMEMRESVIKMIPKIIYADPSGSLETIEDAFAVAVKGVLDRVEGIRRHMKEGKDSSFVNEANWFFKVNATAEVEKWAPFFS